MGAEIYHRVRNRSGLLLLSRVLSLVVATLLLCVTQRASAASVPALAAPSGPANANAAVPMCGAHNESIAAPPIFRVNRDGTLSASPCASTNRFDTHQGAPNPPPRVTIPSSPERAFPLTMLNVVRAVVQRLPSPVRTFELARPGIKRDVFRPPCA